MPSLKRSSHGVLARSKHGVRLTVGEAFVPILVYIDKARKVQFRRVHQFGFDLEPKIEVFGQAIIGLEKGPATPEEWTAAEMEAKREKLRLRYNNQEFEYDEIAVWNQDLLDYNAMRETIATTDWGAANRSKPLFKIAVYQIFAGPEHTGLEFGFHRRSAETVIGVERDLRTFHGDRLHASWAVEEKTHLLPIGVEEFPEGVQVFTETLELFANHNRFYNSFERDLWPSMRNYDYTTRFDKHQKMWNKLTNNGRATIQTVADNERRAHINCHWGNSSLNWFQMGLPIDMPHAVNRNWLQTLRDDAGPLGYGFIDRTNTWENVIMPFDPEHFPPPDPTVPVPGFPGRFHSFLEETYKGVDVRNSYIPGHRWLKGITDTMASFLP